MAISKKEVRETINTLRNLGNRCTLRQLAEVLGRDVNGLSQTLGSRTFRDLIIQESGRGGDRFVRLSEDAKARGPLFPSTRGEQLPLLKSR